jgi:hypothetical protein
VGSATNSRAPSLKLSARINTHSIRTVIVKENCLRQGIDGRITTAILPQYGVERCRLKLQRPLVNKWNQPSTQTTYFREDNAK